MELQLSRNQINAIDFERLVSTYLKLTNWVCGFPQCFWAKVSTRYKFDQIECNIKPNKSNVIEISNQTYYHFNSDQLGEIKRCEQINECPKSAPLVFNLILCFFMMKHFYFVHYSLEQIRNVSPVSLQNYSGQSQVYQYGCLRTNCTKELSRFTGGDEIEGLINLPIFTLCHPNLRPFYVPLTGTHTSGILFAAAAACLYFAVAIIMPINLKLSPIQTDLFVDLLAPNVSLYCTCVSLHKALSLMLYSAINYCRNWKIDPNENLRNRIKLDGRSSRAKRRHKVCSISDPSSLTGISDFKDYQIKMLELRKLELDYSDLDASTRNLIEDCLTIFKTNLWHKISARQFFLSVTYLFVAMLIAAILTGAQVQYMMTIRSRYLRDAEQLIRKSDCQLWSVNLNGPNKQVNLVDAIPSWNITTLAELCIAIVPSLVSVSMLIAYAVSTLQVLYYRIVELVDRVELVNKLGDTIKQLDQADDNDLAALQSKADVSIINNNPLTTDFEFDLLRGAQLNQIKDVLGYALFRSISSRDNRKESMKANGSLKKLIIDQLVESRLTQNELYMSLMIKTYLSARNLMEYAERERDFSTIIPISYALSYSQTIIVIFLLSRLNFSHHIILLTGLAGILFTNSLISTASTLQTESKKLIKVIWQLISSTTHSRNLKVKHLRSLWLKQVVQISRSDGITAIAFGVPVTYSSVIQVVIWSSTLLTLVFSRS